MRGMPHVNGSPITPADTVFLVGAGSQQNSWDPVYAAIEDAQGIRIRDPESANFFFSLTILHRRMVRWTLEQVERGLPTKVKRSREELEEQVRGWRDGHRRLKERISERLAEAVLNDSIPPHPRFLRELTDPKWGRSYVITTNWDRTLQRYVKPTVLHLHGSTENPHTLFLPNEMIEESYRDDEEREAIKDMVAFGWQAIGASPNLCLYGLSLSALDAALGQIISAGLSEHVRPERALTVHIFNCADQLNRVEQRVRLAAVPNVQLTVNLVPVC